MSQPILAYQSFSAGYSGHAVIENISIAINPGETVALIGANGAGKSTLLMSLFSQTQPLGGDIAFEGSSLLDKAPHEISALGISLVPEGRRIFPSLTVLENLQMGARTKAHRDNLPALLKRFPKLSERAKQRAGTLSGGEQQLLAIARALISQPRLLLLDEPSLGLAPQMIQRVFSLLQEIAQSGTTIFLVEQNAHQALSLCDRAYVLAQGNIHLSGTGEALRCDPLVQSAYLGGLS